MDLDEKLAFAPAKELRGLVASKQVSPVELVELYLGRIDELDSRLNSYLTVTREEALRSAGSNPYGIVASNCPAAGTAFLAIRRDPNGNAVMDDIRIQSDINPPNALLGGLAAACGEPGEDITIAHDPAAQTITVLDNNLGGAPIPMTDGVITQLQFTYLDANRVVTANENAIAFVQVAVTAQGPNRDRQLGQPATVTLTSEVRIRIQ